jgi:hypothetical protein
MEIGMRILVVLSVLFGSSAVFADDLDRAIGICERSAARSSAVYVHGKKISRWEGPFVDLCEAVAVKAVARQQQRDRDDEAKNPELRSLRDLTNHGGDQK